MESLDQETKNAIESELKSLSSEFFALSSKYTVPETRRENLVSHATACEAMFRVILKNLRLKVPSLKFKSQYVVYTDDKKDKNFFIADFMILSPKKIAIEIDGSYHFHRKGYDQWRDKILSELGIQVVRISNKRIYHDHGQIEKQLLELLTNVGS